MGKEWHSVNELYFTKSPDKGKAKAQDADDEPKKKDDGPEVRLSEGKFIEGAEGFQFNKKCKVSVKVDYLKKTSRKKVTFKLFAVYNNKEEDLGHQVEGYEDKGFAEAESTLFYGDAYSKALQKDPAAKCSYKFKASHTKGEKEIESELLEMPYEKKLAVDFIEIVDEHFHHNCALPCLDEEGDLLASLQTAFSYIKNNTDRELVVEGHADRSGDEDYNIRISKRRAEAIKALLENDGSLWKGVVESDGKDQKIETEDYQQTLKALSVQYGWPCDPGAVDNKYGQKTEAAAKNFQTEYNKRFHENEQLIVDGKIGPKSWQAIFQVIHDLLGKALKSANLDPPPALKYGYPEGNGIYPCGESSPVTGLEKSEKDRRVELVFYKKGECTPVIAPAQGRKVDKNKDPVTGKDWEKKDIINDPGLIEQIKVTIIDMPNNFAPSSESCTLKYRAEDGEPPAGSKATLRIKDSSGTVIFEKQDLLLEKNKEHPFSWDGKGSDGKYPAYEKGPFVVTVHQTGDPSTESKEKNATVEIAEINLEIKAIDASNRLVENIPEKDFEVIATVYIKKSDGSKVVSQVPITVEFSYNDPSAANTGKNDSYEYTSGKFLGKANDASAVFWKDHSDCDSSSTDGYKTKCKVITITTAGSADLGKAKIYFKPSNVGGDDYKIKATIFAADGTTVLKSKELTDFSIWRKVELTAYEMAGFTHVTTHGTEANMSSYYTNDTNTKYIRGAMNAIGATYKVRYIGLWNHATTTQRNWTTEQQKIPAETPTADEITKANGPAGVDQTAARNVIQAKATAWKDRIFNNMMSGLNNWASDAGIPANSIIALEYCHPKYDSQSTDADAITNEWSAYSWLQISYDGTNIHPDQRWDRAQSFAYQTRVYILAGMTAARYKVVIAHEVGHVTKNQFKRDVFGSGDHSGSAGLMDTTGSVSRFTNNEKKILRGIKP